MQYNYFIKTLKQHQTSHIKALSFPKSCASQKIPHIFLAFVPNIVAILENHIQKLCEPNQVLTLFGFQPTSVPITSNLPLTLNRIIDEDFCTQHLCCSLAYLPLTPNQIEKITTWEKSKTIMVDFTTGLIMDGEHYVSLVLNQPAAGVIYGTLDHSKLTTLWSLINPSKRPRFTTEIRNSAA